MAAGADVKKSGLYTAQSMDLLDFLLRVPRNRSGISSCCQGVLFRLLLKKKPSGFRCDCHEALTSAP